MTLTEFAHELRKIFIFDYLTAECIYCDIFFCMWNGKPGWDSDKSDWSIKDKPELVYAENGIWSFQLTNEVDLSEYKDADGNIDYSKCIVEVEE